VKVLESILTVVLNLTLMTMNTLADQQRLFNGHFLQVLNLPSVLGRCWLGGRKGTRPVKNCVVGCWHGYLSGAFSCFTKIQVGFTFLVLAHPGSPGQRAIKRVL